MQTIFSKNLKNLRLSRKIAQKQAAADMKLSSATLLSHYENGHREPGFAFLRTACDYYGVSADFLLGRICRKEHRRRKQLESNLPDLTATMKTLLSHLEETDDEG